MTGIIEWLSLGAGLPSAAKDVRDFLHEKVKLEEAISDLMGEMFVQHLPRIVHLCPSGTPEFLKADFASALQSEPIAVTRPAELSMTLARMLARFSTTPGASCHPSDFEPIFESIAASAVKNLWRKLSDLPRLASEVNLTHGSELLDRTERLSDEVLNLRKELEKLAQFAQQADRQTWNKLLDSAPPAKHDVESKTYANPFVLGRSEDFNHNYSKLAELFQDSPDWAAIQQRTENVFIEGGRGTGKSMLLRRLTAQACVANARLTQPSAAFSDLKEDYFGVYVKLTRGFYEQFRTVDTIPLAVSELLAQHELNLEIFDAFVDTLRWLDRERALQPPSGSWDAVAKALSALFGKSPQVQTLDALAQTTVRWEQDQIIDYYREKTFSRESTYQGSAVDTVAFLRRLSSTFRSLIFPAREVRLFLLIDEFETLLEHQQIALNTAMKMRLPDLSVKVGVRKAGRKTASTFTSADPIQDPRDYTPVTLDYDVTDRRYKQLLAGIATKRLHDAGYANTNIEAYLPKGDAEVSEEILGQELNKIWNVGRRQKSAPEKEFRERYRVTATYRALASRGRRKGFSGFDTFALLSSGVVSNFIELCKYSFFLALNDKLPLHTISAIPPHLQTDATYYVSERLLNTVASNVPRVGGSLATLVVDLGSVLRQRLLTNASEPEANRLSIEDYGKLSEPMFHPLSEVLDGAVTWTVLHLEASGASFRPKNPYRPQSAELVINRIYCPALGISPRARWRIPISIVELNELIQSSSREATYKKLMSRQETSASKTGDLFPDDKDNGKE